MQHLFNAKSLILKSVYKLQDRSILFVCFKTRPSVDSEVLYIHYYKTRFTFISLSDEAVETEPDRKARTACIHMYRSR